MAERETAVDLDRSDRAFLEVVLARLVRAGHLPPKGEREIRIRLDTAGRVRWFEASTVRVPASELEDAPGPGPDSG